MILASKYYIYAQDLNTQVIGPKTFNEATKLREDYTEMGFPSKILMEVVDEEGAIVNA